MKTTRFIVKTLKEPATSTAVRESTEAGREAGKIAVIDLSESAQNAPLVQKLFNLSKRPSA